MKSIQVNMNTTTAYRLDGQDRWHMSKDQAIKDLVRENSRHVSSNLLSFSQIDWIFDNLEYLAELKKHM